MAPGRHLQAMLCLAAALLPATTASALTCIRPDVSRLYTRAAEAPEPYAIVDGTLTLDASRLPESGGDGPALDTPLMVPGHLTGRALGPGGFAQPFDRAIRVEVSCIGPWCPRMEDSTRLIAAPQVTGEGYLLSLDACYGWIKTDPTEAEVARVETCHAGGDCTPAE